MFDTRGQQYFVLVFPAPFRAMNYINDPRHLEGHKNGAVGGGIEAKKPNVQGRVLKTVSREECRKHELLRMGLLRSFNVG